MVFKANVQTFKNNILNRCQDRLLFEEIPDHITLKIQFYKSPYSTDKGNIADRISLAIYDNDDIVHFFGVYSFDIFNVNNIRLQFKSKLKTLCPNIALK